MLSWWVNVLQCQGLPVDLVVSCWASAISIRWYGLAVMQKKGWRGGAVGIPGLL